MFARQSRFCLLCLVAPILLVTLFWLAACDTSSQLNGSYQQPDDDDSIPVDDDDTTPPDETAPDAPKIDEPISPTMLSYQSIRGTSEASAIIHVTGGLADAEVKADENGDFCVKVALNTNATNILKFVAEDAAGNQSGATSATIEQQVVNLALAGSASASSVSTTRPENIPDNVNDDSYLTKWENSTNSLTNPDAERQPQWLAIQLEKPYYLTNVGVLWGKSTTYEYGTNFAVYINTQTNPVKMPHEVTADQLASYGYVFIDSVDQEPDENIERNDIEFSDSSEQAYWVFLILYESNNQNVLTGFYSFQIAEFEAYGFEEPDEECE